MVTLECKRYLIDLQQVMHAVVYPISKNIPLEEANNVWEASTVDVGVDALVRRVQKHVVQKASLCVEDAAVQGLGGQLADVLGEQALYRRVSRCRDMLCDISPAKSR